MASFRHEAKRGLMKLRLYDTNDSNDEGTLGAGDEKSERRSDFGSCIYPFMASRSGSQGQGLISDQGVSLARSQGAWSGQGSVASGLWVGTYLEAIWGIIHLFRAFLVEVGRFAVQA